MIRQAHHTNWAGTHAMGQNCQFGTKLHRTNISKFIPLLLLVVIMQQIQSSWFKQLLVEILEHLDMCNEVQRVIRPLTGQ